MKLIDQKAKVRCDIANCKNLASISIASDDGNAKDYINLCPNCLKSLYELLAQKIVPKPVINAMSNSFNKGKGKRL